MTERQKKVLKYVLEHKQVGIRELGEACGFNVKIFATNHDCCVALRNEIEKINKDKTHPFLIMYDEDYNYWVEKDNQAKVRFLREKKLNPALKKLHSYWAGMSKIENENQISFDEFLSEVAKEYGGKQFD